MQGGATHSFFDMAREDVNLKVLRAAVALSEAEAVTLQGAIFPSGTEQHFIDREGGNLSASGLVNDPEVRHTKSLNCFTKLLSKCIHNYTKMTLKMLVISVNNTLQFF